MSIPLEGRIAVLSPHLDDAALSLGATIAAAARRGGDVRVVTVLAGEPSSSAPAGPWDRQSGFELAGEAARVRREEDAAACSILGASPVWLPYGDGQYGHGAGDEEIWQAVNAAVADADIALVPGFPLTNADHAWLAQLALGRRLAAAQVGLYVEHPYRRWGRRASRDPAAVIAPLLSGPPSWIERGPTFDEWLVKRRAVSEYRSQLPQLGLAPSWRRTIRLLQDRREAIAWPARV